MSTLYSILDIILWMFIYAIPFNIVFHVFPQMKEARKNKDNKDFYKKILTIIAELVVGVILWYITTLLPQ